ncbi:hypothetical protein HDU99_000724, partial [Rhizoclosmatium hyalinum]
MTSKSDGLKWIGTSPIQPDAVWSAEVWVDNDAEDDAAPNTTTGDTQLERLAPLSIAEDLAHLRQDLKGLAMSQAKRNYFQKVGSDDKPSDSVKEVGTVNREPFELDLRIQKGLPGYIVTLKQAENILLNYSQVNISRNLSEEEFLSVMDAQLKIRELEKVLLVKDKEAMEKERTISDLKERILSLETRNTKLQELVDSATSNASSARPESFDNTRSS